MALQTVDDDDQGNGLAGFATLDDRGRIALSADSRPYLTTSY